MQYLQKLWKIFLSCYFLDKQDPIILFLLCTVIKSGKQDKTKRKSKSKASVCPEKELEESCVEKRNQTSTLERRDSFLFQVEVHTISSPFTRKYLLLAEFNWLEWAILVLKFLEIKK